MYLYTSKAWAADIFLVIAYMRTKPIHKQIKSKYPEECSTLDKVKSGKWKTFTE